MRLYSRSQLFIFAGLALLAGFVLAIGGVFLSGRQSLVKAENASAIHEVVQNPGFPDEPDTIPARDGDDEPLSALRPVDSLPGYTLSESENINVYEKLNQGVVHITTEVMVGMWFADPVPRDGGTGSGSIIDSRGYVLTNYHVVKGTYRIYVSLWDGSNYEATVVGTDQENDLAVIKFEPEKGTRLTVIPYGSSTGLKVGQKVLAIGNPFGLERTLTVGIVSALGRAIQQSSTSIIRDMIQTDASINPGNSGGPLLNARGEMIGINTMIYSESGGSVGLGFAVPVDTAKRVVPELIATGTVKRGWIEAEFVQLFPALVDYMNDKGSPYPVNSGLLLSTVRSAGNAARAGLQGGATAVRYSRSTFNVGGDLIVEVDGMAVSSIADLYAALEDNKPGETVKVVFYRGKNRMTANVLLSDRAESLGK